MGTEARQNKLNFDVKPETTIEEAADTIVANVNASIANGKATNATKNKQVTNKEDSKNRRISIGEIMEQTAKGDPSQ